MLLKEMREAFDEAQAYDLTGDIGRLMMTVAAPFKQETIDLVFDYKYIFTK